MNFEDPESLRSDVKKKLRNEEDFEFELEQENILENLFHAVLVCKKEFNWSNAGIKNKEKQLLDFKKAWNNDREFQPDFEFSSPKYSLDSAISFLETLEGSVQKIDRETVSNLELETLNREDLRNLFRGIFEEYRLYLRLHNDLKNKSQWQNRCTDIWHFDKKTARYANKQLRTRDFKDDEGEKDLSAKKLSDMMEDEIKRLGMKDYEVEISNVDGCHNVPEQRKLVVAAGRNRERKYSYSEAQMLTVHEVFHAVRCYNGYETTKDTDIPPILGLHTPFYDQAEEGGAVFREFETGKIWDWKEKDYYLRTIAASCLNKGLTFEKSVEKLLDLGASLSRAYGLLARNREILRHQIYLAGYLDWKTIDNMDRMMVGKVNQKWSKKIWREVQRGNQLNEPEISSKEVFQSNSFAFDT